VCSVRSQMCHLGRAVQMIAPCVLILNLPRRRKCRTGHTFGLTESSVMAKIRTPAPTGYRCGHVEGCYEQRNDAVMVIVRPTASSRNPTNIRRPCRATWTEGRAVFIGHDDVSGTLDGLSSAGTAGEQPATSVTRKRFQPVEDRRGRRWLTRPRIRGHVWGCRGRRHDLRRQ
jgi:hypothetical protein